MIGTVVALVLAFALAVSTGISLYQRISDGHLLVIGIAIFAVCFAVLAKLFSMLGWLTGKGGQMLSSRKGRVALALFVGLGISSYYLAPHWKWFIRAGIVCFGLAAIPVRKDPEGEEGTVVMWHTDQAKKAEEGTLPPGLGRMTTRTLGETSATKKYRKKGLVDIVDNAKARIHLKQETKTAQVEQDQLIAQKKVAEQKKEKYDAERKLERAPKADIIDELQLDMDLQKKWKQHQEGDRPTSSQSPEDQKFDEAVRRADKQREWEIYMEMSAPLRSLEALDRWFETERQKIREIPNSRLPASEKKKRIQWLEELYQRKKNKIMRGKSAGQVYSDE